MASGALLTGFPQFPDERLDPKLYAALSNIHLAIQNLNLNTSLQAGIVAYDSTEWASLVPTGAFLLTNVSRVYIPAGAAISAGQVVNFYDAGGTLKCRLAKADSPSTFACGIANSGGNINDIIEVIWLRGTTGNIGGLLRGFRYFLSATVGGAIDTIEPSTAGHIKQVIGLAVDTAKFMIDIPLQFEII